MDFLRLLVNEDGSPVTEDEIFTPETQDGKRVITGGGVMATPDECSPRNVSVRLPLDYSTSNVAYWPECTMVQRCGGCTQPNLACEPLYKEKIVLKVMRAEYSHPGAMNLQWKGYQSVEVERHLSCRPTCTLNATICGPLKTFQPYQCKCQCKSFSQCNSLQRWDETSCSCGCPNALSCCPAGQDQSTCQNRFDHATCRCMLKEAISADRVTDLTLAELDAYRQSQTAAGTDLSFEQWLEQSAGSQAGADLAPDTTPANDGPTTPPAPTTTTATTTTTTTTAPAPEATVTCLRQCPNGFQPAIRDGRCICQLGGRLGSQRNPALGRSLRRD